MVVDVKQLKKMSDEDIREFIAIGERGLRGPWKGHRHEALCRQALADLKDELRRRKQK